MTSHERQNVWNHQPLLFLYMMTSSNGNIFRVTGPLCGEFTGPGEFPAQRPVTRSLDVFFDLRLNKRLSKQPRGWWFETSSWSLWCHCNVNDCLGYNQRKHQMLALLGLCEGNPLVIGGFPLQRASNVKMISKSWRHYDQQLTCFHWFRHI